MDDIYYDPENPNKLKCYYEYSGQMRDELTSLRCTICKRYLTVGPVMKSADDVDFQCGRCDFFNPNINIRYVDYEELADYMLFPCNYHQCDENLIWEDVEEHELVCPYRTINCPIEKCGFSSLTSEMKKHFSSHRKDISIHYGAAGIIFRLSNPHTFLGVLIYNEKAYIYFISKNQRHIKVSVYSIEFGNNEKYEVSVSTEFGRKLPKFRGNIIQYDDTRHCFSCCMGRCASKVHKFSTNYGHEYQMSTVMDIKELPDMLEADIVWCQILVTETVEEIETFQQKPEDYDLNSEDDEC